MKFEIENKTLIAVTLEDDEKEVVIPDGVTTIASSAFLRCRNIEKVIIPSSVKTIEGKTFFKTNIKEIEIPSSVEYIGSSCFGSCANLKKIDIKANIKKIEEYCFNCCSSLEEIILPDTLESIGKFAFCNSKKIKNINLPSSLKEIKSYAFGSCDGIEKMEIPDSVDSIGSSAFNSCINMKKVKLPNNLSCLNHSTFFRCSSLKEINLPSSLEVIEEKNFFECESLEEMILPSKLEKIGPSTFSGCKNLKEIKIPYGITCIDDNMFSNCKNLKSVFIPASVKTLESFSFFNCESLEEINLSHGLDKIKDSSFSGCSNLSKIVLPITLKEIHHSVFNNCTKLKELTFPESLKEIAPFAFTNCDFDRVTINSFSQLQLRRNIVFYYLDKVYFNEETKSMILSKFDEQIDGYERLNYRWFSEKLDLSDFRTAAILSLVLKEEEKNIKLKYLFSNIARNINKHNYQELREKIGNSTEFNRLVNYVKKDVRIEEFSKSIEFCDLFKLAYSLGAFNEDQIDRQRACEFIKNCFDKGFFSLGNIHGSFESMEINNFNGECATFLMNKNNLKEVVALEKEQSGYISRIHNSFSAIKEYGRSNRGNQHYRKVTLDMVREYLSRVYFSGVDESNIDISQTIGEYTRNQESFDEAVDIRKDYLDLKERKEIRDNIINDVEEILDDLSCIANSKFSYEFLSKFDPRNFVLGKYCSCCAHLEGMGRGIMKASILHPDCQNLVIKDSSGDIIAKSTLYVNRRHGYGLFNNIEINNNIYDEETKLLIYEKYIEAIDVFAKAYNKENPNNPIKQINVGMHLNDLNKIIRMKHSSSNILEGIHFSDYGGYEGDWQSEQYVIWKDISKKR